MMECKKALVECNGNVDSAIEALRIQGQAKADKKASRIAAEGLVTIKLDEHGKSGVLVEVNCETDFVARTDDFQSLAHDLAMQVAAMAPVCVDETDLLDEGGQDPQEVCLLLQPYIKEPSVTVQDHVNETVSKVGENIRIRRFERFALGE